MTDHDIFGWRLRTDLPLPELLPWRGEDRPVDIQVTLGPAPPLAPPVQRFGPAVEIGVGAVRVTIPDVAVYGVEGGRRITIQTDLSPTDPAIRTFLFGTVLTVICFQRGRLPLHASVVEVGGRALVLAGDSGSGKSTLAAALLRRGHRLLSDDVCLLEVEPGDGPVVRSAFPRLRLWDEAARHLGIDTVALEPVSPSLPKHHVPVAPDDFQPVALSPALVVCLTMVEQRDVPPTLQRLGQGVAMMHYPMIHRWRLGMALGQAPLFFTGLATLVRHCPVMTLVLSRSLDTLDATVDRLLALALRDGVADGAT